METLDRPEGQGDLKSQGKTCWTVSLYKVEKKITEAMP